MREFSFRAVILGVVIGALLAAANAFVGLKVGMTISASIPAAVVALLIMRKLLRTGTLLESNMVQTVGSAGESVAAGMIFTLPALFIMGNEPQYLSMVIWGGIGGLLGVCFMVPLRKILIVKEHGVLPFPEGVACAEVLETGERGGAGARYVIWGALVGGVYYLFELLGIWKETGKISIRRFHTEAQLDSSPALLGVGYILGVRIAAYMLAGAILSWFILIPAIGFFGADAGQPVFPAKDQSIAGMSPDDVYKHYIRYIGAGAVAIGGLISLIKSMGTIGSSVWHVITGIFRFGRGSRSRTDKDFPFLLLVLIVAGLGYAMWHFEQVRLNPIGVVAVLVFSFFFVTVSSRLVGIVGSSSNPISGMTIATLLATALIYKFFVMDRAGAMTDAEVLTLQLTCLSVGAIVAIAIAVAGDTSQDLKTGFLVKATPYKQQIGEMIGVLTSVVAIAGLLLLLNKTYGFTETPETPHPLPAYQANIMKILVEGVLGGEIPWTLIMIGGAAAVVVELLGLPALPFAVGMYLPLGLSTPIMVGGLVRWLVTRRKKTEAEHDPGVLTSSGLVAGQGLIGVALAGVSAFITWWWTNPYWMNPLSETSEPVSPMHFGPWLMDRIDAIPPRWGLSEVWWDALPMLPFIPLVIWLWWCACKRPPLAVPPDTAPVDGPTAPPKPSDPSRVSPTFSPALGTPPPDTGRPAPPAARFEVAHPPEASPEPEVAPEREPEPAPSEPEPEELPNRDELGIDEEQQIETPPPPMIEPHVPTVFPTGVDPERVSRDEPDSRVDEPEPRPNDEPQTGVDEPPQSGADDPFKPPAPMPVHDLPELPPVPRMPDEPEEDTHRDEDAESDQAPDPYRFSPEETPDDEDGPSTDRRDDSPENEDDPYADRGDDHR